MDLSSVIKSLYPDIKDSEFALKDDNGVRSIIKWLYNEPQPTIEFLEDHIAEGELWAAKRIKKLELNSKCRESIASSFTSQALGAIHTYPSQEGNSYFDQTNLNNAAIVANLPGLPNTWAAPLWCKDQNDSWIFSEHTASQINQVISDFLNQKNMNRSYLMSLIQSIENASDVEVVNSINW